MHEPNRGPGPATVERMALWSVDQLMSRSIDSARLVVPGLGLFFTAQTPKKWGKTRPGPKTHEIGKIKKNTA